MKTSRRTFMQTLAATTVVTNSFVALSATCKGKITLGICATPARAEKLKEAGFAFIEGSVGNTLKPDMPDAEFAPELEKLKNCALPIQSCNGFIPGKFHLTGDNLMHDEALDYAVVACKRADAVGIPHIVLGSGTARKVPDGFDPVKGKEQFIDFCRKLGERIKDLKVTIVLEPLNKTETNLLNSVREGIEFVDAINHPRIQLLADFYHMLMENESADSIIQAGARIKHCHIAELEGRSAPGTHGEDLSAYFQALKSINYTGGVSCECRWPKENVEDAWRKALKIMRTQLGCCDK